MLIVHKKWVYVHTKIKQKLFDSFEKYDALSISLMLAQILDLPNGNAKYIQILLEHSYVTCGCYDTEFIWILLVFGFFTIFVINVLQKSK